MSDATPGVAAGTPLEPEAALELVSAACYGPLTDAWDRLETRAEASVGVPLDEGIASHRALLEVCQLTGDEPPPPARAELLRRYRHGVADAVIPALERAVREGRPTGLAIEVFQEGSDAAWSRCGTLPDGVEVRWGQGALEPVPSDPFLRRVRKSVARLGSPARKPDGSRVAPVRAVARRHLHEVVPDFGALCGEGVRAWASWVARMSWAWSEWADAALPILASIDAPELLFDELADRAPPESAADDGPDPAPLDDVTDAVSVEAWARVRETAVALQAALEELRSGLPHTEIRARSEALLERSAMALSSEVRASGSFAYRPAARNEADAPVSRDLARTRDRFKDWDAGEADRLRLYRSMLEILLGTDAVLNRLADGIRGEVLDPLTGFEQGSKKLVTLAGEARERLSPEPTDEALADLRTRALEAVTEASECFPDSSAVDRTLDSLIGGAMDALQGIVRQAPEALVFHRLDEDAPDAARPEDTRSVAFREQARRSLDALRIERIRAGVLAIGPGLSPLRGRLSELPDVITFAFDEAGDELEVPAGKKGHLGEEEPEPAQAVMLSVEALEQSARVLAEAPTSTQAVLRGADKRVRREAAEGALALLERLGAGRMQSQLLQARSRFSDIRTRIDDRLRPIVRRLARGVRYRYLRARRAGKHLFRAVQGLLGRGPTPAAAKSLRAIRAFASMDAGLGRVPLVYHRLFSLDAVTDPTFLVGRSAELAEVLARWKRWQEEDSVPLVVRGNPGTGVTSFLNVVADAIEEEGARVSRFDVSERIADEATLADRLAGVLGVPSEPTLGALASRILASQDQTLPNAVVLDGLSHLYLRVPGGSDVLERFLTFMSETEPRVFWILGTSQPAWQLISKLEPVAVFQVDDLELPPLQADRLRETMLQRHRRSGLRLRFVEPEEGRAFLRRRLRRLQGTEGHQKLLEADFFEQLEKVSLGNLRLALFHWLLAADFESVPGQVSLRTPVRPDFAVLDTLALTQNFTLKAMLESRTLTLAEHDAVFRMKREESYQVFESLQNRRLIEEMDSTPSWEHRDSEIARQSRYRIRPLLVGAVTAHLRSRNIVH